MNEILRNLSCLRLLFIIMLVCAIWQAMLREFRLRTQEFQSKAGGDEAQKHGLYEQ